MKLLILAIKMTEVSPKNQLTPAHEVQSNTHGYNHYASQQD